MLFKPFHLFAGGVGALALFLSAPVCNAQNWGRDWDANRGLYSRIEPGVGIPVRLNETINVNRRDNRVYYGTVDQDIRGDNGRIAIPRGSQAELMVRVAPDNDLNLDLESVVVNGQRYAVRSNPNHFEAQRDNSLVGNIVGAVTGAQVRGQAVRVPRDAVITFRLDRPLEVGITDRGVEREGHHYHDWYDHDHDRDHQ